MRKIIFALLILFSSCLYAIDIGMEFTMGNMDFTDNFSATDDFTGLQFPYAFSILMEDKISNEIDVEISLNQDAILRRYAHSLFIYRTNFFSIGLGPTFGAFNSLTTPVSSGLSTYFKVEIPTIVFVTVEADNSLGTALINTGDYIQSATVLSGGGYVPGIIWSLNLTTKTFSQMIDASTVMKDNFTEYAFKTDMYKKNTDFHVNLNAGYQIRSKTFTGAATTTQTLHSVILGLKSTFKPIKPLTVIVGVEGSMYTFGLDDLAPLSNPGPYGMLFNGTIGAKINL